MVSWILRRNRWRAAFIRHRSGLAVPAEQEAAAPVTASNPLAGVTVLGLVMLAVLGAALYKAV